MPLTPPICTTTRSPRRALVPAAAAVVLAAVLSGCSAPQQAAPVVQATPTSSPEGPGHVHGAYVDPRTGGLLLATHHGLFDATTKPATRIGPVIDLMGFVANADGTFYASGHPGRGVGLPDPLGLIASTDGGANWTPVSRQGESDFHALATTAEGIVGFDGELRTSADGREWATVTDGPAPYALTGNPQHQVVLATTEAGLWRSEDGGATWKAPADGPVLITAAFVDARTVVGVSPAGGVYASVDVGRSWKSVGKTSGQPAAITGTRTDDGHATIWVVGVDGGTERLEIP